MIAILYTICRLFDDYIRYKYPQLKRYTHVTCMLHACSKLHIRGFLRQHTRVHARAVFMHVRVFTRMHTYMATIASMLASYFLFSLSYNTITQFFPCRAWAAYQGMEDEIIEEAELRSLLL